ncbi:MAG TPA: glycosyltransferase [Anaerolineales bacterium]|nr:glycosyltransferase [Anaerolineales bacterium]
MQVLLSSIGSRGDVQPIVALGLELQALGHRARLCVAPNFKEWIESYGLECIPIGPDLKKMTGGTVPGKPVLPFSKEQLQQLADQMVRGQFQVIGEAARGCDLIVAAGALQIATRSIAEAQNIPYIFVAYCPAVLPSSKYPPPKMSGHYSHSLSEAENEQLWREDEESFDKFGAALNEERAKIGQGPVTNVQRYMFTDRPWLAADPVLAPAFPLAGMEVVQTGAWMISEETPLPDEIEEFLAAGAPPVYLGFGSMRASDQTAPVLIEAARALGLRSILSQGWAGLTPGDMGPANDCLSIGDVNHGKLFPRVAAIVHHGGAGTTATAARAGTAQVIIPHNYDQFYWAHRVQQLGVGVSGPLRDDITVENLAQALRAALQPEMTRRAREVEGRIELHGARLAAERLTNEFGF